MAKKKSQSLLSSYRKKQRNTKTVTTILAGVLIVAGLVLIVLWATGSLGGRGLALFSTRTPTPTITLTPTPVTPTSTPTLTATVTETPTITPTLTPAGPVAYVVQENDNCTSIAEKFNADLQVLLVLNGLDNNCVITVGSTIQVPASWQQMPTSTPLPTDIKPGTVLDYIVEPGASLRSIAQFFNSTIAKIVIETNKYNQAHDLPLINENSSLQIGQLIKVPVNLVTPVPSATPTRTMTPSPKP